MKDKEVIVHEQLSAIQRDRYQTCRQKFMTLDGMQKKGKLWEDLETIRAGVATETAAMARRKLLMNYHWYHDLIMELPPGIQDDRFLAHILLRLRYLAKEFAELGPYRLSKNRLLRVLAHLRPWEREAPDIKKAIDFVRDHVIYTSLAEYEEYVAEREIAMATERRPKSATFVSLSKKAK
ncbi:uncharacterized protein LOC134195846 isoform X1 [Corticium candelabrum]|uniref:uncharacterized protein LOC134195846 isoform X1 n=1 Tax=Corticium candelabrum TaxID=121492 RepID=UPI002E26B528|nr:uncharacterized protein LOC134195846 isoform X1 [Corticium candelabrum]